MKKNVKILGAAAAALLAVAPVATTGVAPGIGSVAFAKGTNDGSDSDNAIDINVTASSLTVAAGTKSDAYLGNNAFVANTTAGTVVPQGTSTLHDDTTDTDVAAGAKLQKGHVYTQKESVIISGLQQGKWYNVNGTADQVTAYSQFGTPQISRTIYVTDSNDATQPYFTDATSEQLANGAVAKVGTNGEGVALTGTANVDNILNAAKENVTLHGGTDSNTSAVVTTTASDIASQLAGQGLTVKDGIYTIPESGFHVTLTGMNTTSGKTVTVVVPFSGKAADYSSYPLIKYNYNKISNQGPLSKQTPTASNIIYKVPVGGSFNPTSVVKAQASKTDETSLDISVVSNPVNVNVPGKYTVEVRATNWTTNKTSYFAYTVQVGSSDTTYQTVNYVSGYGVNVWNIAGNVVSFNGNRVKDGKILATYDTKTVNGVSYTRINSKTSNEWIQTQYLDGSWKHSNNNTNTNKPSTSSEEKVSGVATVTYKGRGGVNLLNAEGKYQNQYVKKGSAWKVFAKKTINGEPMYRLGTQSQWIPAKYVSVK
jgi:hypothetical protein